LFHQRFDLVRAAAVGIDEEKVRRMALEVGERDIPQILSDEEIPGGQLIPLLGDRFEALRGTFSIG
jgi:hypothetical protein